MEEKERQKAKAKNQIKSEIPNIDLTIGSVKGNLHSSSSLIDGDGDGESVTVTVSRKDWMNNEEEDEWNSEDERWRLEEEWLTDWNENNESMNPT